MQQAVIRIELEYNFPDDVSVEEIVNVVENVELPNEYSEDSFEWKGIHIGDEYLPYYKFPEGIRKWTKYY